MSLTNKIFFIKKIIWKFPLLTAFSAHEISSHTVDDKNHDGKNI